MFRSFSPANRRREEEQGIPPSQGKILNNNSNDNAKHVFYHGSNSNNINNNNKLRFVRDRTNETQTTAGESQGTISSLSGIYSTDLLKDIYALSESGSESEYDAHNYSADYNIVSISKDESLLDRHYSHDDDDDEEEEDSNNDDLKIIDEIDLDAASASTTVTGNQAPYPTPYTNGQSFPAIVKNSSWVEDKPFDEESLLNLSDVGAGNKKAILPSYYSHNTIPVKEYILPPPSPVSMQSLPPPPPPPMQRSLRDHVDEIIEISPDADTEKSLGRVAWARDHDTTEVEDDEDEMMYGMESMAESSGTGSAAKARGTRSTVSASSRQRSFKSDQQRRSRRLKVCILAGCLVSLLCLIVIIVSVALSKKNSGQDLSAAAAAAQNGQTTAPTMLNDRDFIASPAPSLRVTSSPSQVPVNTNPTSSGSVPWLDNSSPNPTESPTMGPTTNPTLEPTREPTPEPTFEPTRQPTSEPTREPTREPTQDPTVRPTVNVTPGPTGTQPPTCASTISVSQDCFFMTDNVLVVEFDNCDPRRNDWVGIYPAGAEFQECRVFDHQLDCMGLDLWRSDL